MKSITIHGVDSELETALRKRAKDLELDLGETIKTLLRTSLGLRRKKRDISKFSGSWSKEEFEEFERNTAAFGEVKKNDDSERIRKELGNSVLRYDDPLEPVGLEDWEVLKE